VNDGSGPIHPDVVKTITHSGAIERAKTNATEAPAVVTLSEMQWHATHFARTADRVKISIMICRASSARL